jgi:hypothetical protein
MSVAAAPGGLAGPDGAARWADIQRRADDLAQTLYALREEVPPDSPDGARIADTLASLQAVRSAMDAERFPGGVSLGQADAVRSRLASFEYSLGALGAPARSLPRPGAEVIPRSRARRTGDPTRYAQAWPAWEGASGGPSIVGGPCASRTSAISALVT